MFFSAFNKSKISNLRCTHLADMQCTHHADTTAFHQINTTVSTCTLFYIMHDIWGAWWMCSMNSTTISMYSTTYVETQLGGD